MTKPTALSKLAITIGALSFSAEGDADWCEKQLKTVLAATTGTDAKPVRAESASEFSETLTSCLKAHSRYNQRLHS